jgi:hypothetical protein
MMLSFAYMSKISILRVNATHALKNSLIANLEHVLDAQQHKPRAPLAKLGFRHYLLLNDGSRHGSTTFLVGVSSMLLPKIFHLEESNVSCIAFANTLH